MQMDISLSNVNVGMPLSVHDKYLVEGRSLYLIRPFDVKVAVNPLDCDVFVAAMFVFVSVFFSSLSSSSPSPLSPSFIRWRCRPWTL